MSPYIYYLAGGFPFFIGAAMIIVASFVFGATKPRRRAAQLTAVLGAVMVVVSVTPAPLWFYSSWVVVVASWLFGPFPAAWLQKLRGAAVLLSLVAAAWEAAYQFGPRLSGSSADRLIVIGDSISAGAGEKRIVCWPTLLADQQGIRVLDKSFAGANVKSAQKQAEAAGDAGGVILLEIGGNDVLGFTTPAEFERGLDDLLRSLQRADRQLVMFELPLPPLYNAFGETQRRLSFKYSVRLIPKREFLAILTSPNATSDGIHLTQSGQQKMSDCVWRHLRAAFGK